MKRNILNKLNISKDGIFATIHQTDINVEDISLLDKEGWIILTSSCYQTYFKRDK